MGKGARIMTDVDFGDKIETGIGDKFTTIGLSITTLMILLSVVVLSL